MLLPKFVGIGAPRCGTRWLTKCLSEHPEILVFPEEMYFFTTRRVVHSYWSKGLQWYSSQFERYIGPQNKTWGEITPIYLFDDDTPRLMHQCVPEAKLICCLRDQTERAYSWYRLFLHVNPDIFFTNYSFRQFLTYHTEVYGREGFYLEHLRKYMALYPRDSMLILLYDDLQKDPAQYIQPVFRFLNVKETFLPPSLNKRINPMLLEIPKNRILQQIATHFKRYRRLTKIALVLEKINTLTIGKADFPARHQPDIEMRTRMAELYRDHNKELGQFLDRDLSHWNLGNYE